MNDSIEPGILQEIEIDPWEMYVLCICKHNDLIRL